MSPESVSLLDSDRLRAGTRKSMSRVRVSPEGVSLLDSKRNWEWILGGIWVD